MYDSFPCRLCDQKTCYVFAQFSMEKRKEVGIGRRGEERGVN